MRARALGGWRVLALLACAAGGLLWACVSLLGEHEAQQQLLLLQRRVAGLEAQLEEEHRQAAAAANSSAALAEALRARLQELAGQVEALRPGPAPPGPTGATLRLGPAPPGPAGPPPESSPVRLTDEALRELAVQGAVGVAVITCQRPEYLRRAMGSFLHQPRDPQRFPIVISQDGSDPAVEQLIERDYAARGLAAHIHHEHERDAEDIARKYNRLRPKQAIGYVRIAQHYGFVMRKMFDEFRFQQVIFLEEDMEISPDFFSYFGRMLELVRKDPMLFCVSAWNDNGYESLVADTKAAFRTDFFPGLGWMMEKRIWDELRDRWTSAYWDEFMRRPDVRKGRHCIRPEVSRSSTFGKQGTSAGLFYEKHLSRIRLNNEAVDWAAVDLGFLASQAAFDAHLLGRLRAAVPVALGEVAAHDGRGETLRILYDDKRDYPAVCRKFDLMPDEKEGIRRMSYRGVIPFSWRGNAILLYTSAWPASLA